MPQPSLPRDQRVTT
uniref:Uncharacterized protein n=1 Tax=Rhizophora mucronata TaxID=61149 RepID=A0A2P2Q781_RHIMU